jgi:Putative transposase, YhgA-like
MTKINKTKPNKSKQPKSTGTTVKRTKDHDIFVRGILSINALVLKLLLHYIPKDIQPFMDFDTLKVVPDSQVSGKLKFTQSDSIHECALNVTQLPESIRNSGNLPLFRFCFFMGTQK